jgi:hypothetical protein
VSAFGDVRFPGNRADCEKCHLPDTFLLPLPAGLLSTQLTKIVSGVDTPVGSIPPIQDACLACHDDPATAAHAATNTGPGGAVLTSDGEARERRPDGGGARSPQ